VIGRPQFQAYPGPRPALAEIDIATLTANEKAPQIRAGL